MTNDKHRETAASDSHWTPIKTERDLPKESGKSYYWTGRDGSVSQFAYYALEKAEKTHILCDYIAWAPVPDKPAPYNAAISAPLEGEVCETARRYCSCLGSCKGRERLSENYICSLMDRPGLNPIAPPLTPQAVCGGECGYQEPYGFVPMADCPVHDPAQQAAPDDLVDPDAEFQKLKHEATLLYSQSHANDRVLPSTPELMAVFAQQREQQVRSEVARELGEIHLIGPCAGMKNGGHCFMCDYIESLEGK